MPPKRIPPEKLYEEEWMGESKYVVRIYTPDGLLHQERILIEMTGEALERTLQELRSEGADILIDSHKIKERTTYTVKDFKSYHPSGCYRSIDAVEMRIKDYREILISEYVIPLVNSFSGQR